MKMKIMNKSKKKMKKGIREEEIKIGMNDK
jgi:hypothetical protein